MLLLVCIALFMLRMAIRHVEQLPISEKEASELEAAWAVWQARLGIEDSSALPSSKLLAERGHAGPRGPLSPFDPNTAGREIWERAGLGEKTIRAILNYRAKGGRFRRPDDLAKIYGLSQEQYARLVPYLKFPLPTVPSKLDVNKADSAQWERLRGIGPVLARRIVRYRELLGGFASLEQLQEVYGLSEATYTMLQEQVYLEGAGALNRLDANLCAEKALARHPYIGSALARQILAGRPYASVEDIKALPLINEEKYRKIAPYLSVARFPGTPRAEDKDTL